MTTERHPATWARTARRAAACMAAALLLAACGGGSSDGQAAASSATASGTNGQPVMYSKPLLITVFGSALDQGIVVTSPGCKAGPTLSTTSPYVSTADRAYYLCTVSGQGPNVVNVDRASDSVRLTTAAYTVPVPQVTLVVNSDSGLSGLLVLALDPAKKPLTVDNFLAYVNSRFYDGTVFHDLAAGFVMKAGSYLPFVPGEAPVLQAPLAAPIPLEAARGLSNTQWSLAMWHDADPNSATSQFFINVVDNSSKLDPGGSLGGGVGYAVFGSVLSTSTALAGAILAAPCAPVAGFPDPAACVPNPNVAITAAIQSQ